MGWEMGSRVKRRDSRVLRIDPASYYDSVMKTFPSIPGIEDMNHIIIKGRPSASSSTRSIGKALSHPVEAV